MSKRRQPVPFEEETALLSKVSEEKGYSVEWRNPGPPTYQLAKITGPGFCLIAYPHKTSAGHHHIRLRDERSKDKRAADIAILEFDKAAGNNCTFQSKHMRTVEHRVRKGLHV